MVEISDLIHLYNKLMSIFNPTLTYQVLDSIGNLIRYEEYQSNPAQPDFDITGNFTSQTTNGQFNFIGGNFYSDGKIIVGSGIIQERFANTTRDAIKFQSLLDLSNNVIMGGTIDLGAVRGGENEGYPVAPGGSIISRGYNIHGGGSINLSAGQQGPGGSISSIGDSAPGGSISLNGGAGGAGGSISANASAGQSAGGINLNAGQYFPGGSLTTENGGGSINTSQRGGSILTNGTVIDDVQYTLGGGINLANNSGANFSIQPGNFPENDADGSIFNRINDNLYIKKNSEWLPLLIPSTPPISPNSIGNSGNIAFDDNYFYRHNGVNWTRTAMSTW